MERTQGIYDTKLDAYAKEIGVDEVVVFIRAGVCKVGSRGEGRAYEHGVGPKEG